MACPGCPGKEAIKPASVSIQRLWPR